MPEPAKKTINAKEILRDIESGLSRDAIRAKYGLSEKGFDSVRLKLIEKGFLKQDKPTQQKNKVAKPVVKAPYERWSCPHCHAEQDHPFDECPRCGLVVSKFKDLPLEPPVVTNNYRHIEPSAPPKQENLGRNVLISILVIAVCAIGIIMFSSQKGKGVKTGYSSSDVQKFTVNNFNYAVLDRSKTSPVLVMFHARW